LGLIGPELLGIKSRLWRAKKKLGERIVSRSTVAKRLPPEEYVEEHACTPPMREAPAMTATPIPGGGLA
jgi:hypothetical protein